MLHQLFAASISLSASLPLGLAPAVSVGPAAPPEPAFAAQNQDKVAWFQGDLEPALAEAKVKSKLAMA